MLKLKSVPAAVSGALQTDTTQKNTKKNAMAAPFSMLKLKSVPGAISGTLQENTTQKTHEKKRDSGALFNAEIEERSRCNFWHSPRECDTRNKRKKKRGSDALFNAEA